MSLIQPIRGFALFFFMTFLAALAILVYMRRSGMPARMDDHVLNDLDAEVSVRFDTWGVPHVTAANDLDLFRAMGWLHANDRITQMELGRRQALGRLAEVVGEVGISSDVYFHRLRFPETVDLLWENASDESKEILQAYSEGVNAWLLERKERVPPGLKLLGIVPDPWMPEHSLAFSMLMAQDLSFWNQRPEEERFLWLKAFGADGVRDLLGDPDLHVPDEILALALGTEASNAGTAEAADAEGLTIDPAAIEEGDPPNPGSNNWAIGGSRTASGKPLLANDPHLGLTLPSVWYQIQLRGPSYEAAGMSLPGAPGVVIGRGPAMAWAFTNTMLDDHDVFFEKINDQGQVLRGETWQDVITEERRLHLKDGGTHTFTVSRTDIGPLLEADETRGLPARSIAWTAYLGADPIAVLRHAPSATSPEELIETVKPYGLPAQNMVATFPTGDMMFTVIGKIPNRRMGDGRLPSPAWNTSYGWDGARPRDTNPTWVRPEEDILVTANHDIRPPGYDLPLTAEFFAPFRADRIRQRLDEKSDWDRESFARVQTDSTSLFALAVKEALDADAPYDDETFADAQKAYELIAKWNGKMTLKGAPALFALFERELSQRIFLDETAAAGLKRSVSHRDRIFRILRGAMNPSWFDDVTTEPVEDRKEILTASLDAAWKKASEFWPVRASQWDYGWLHSLRLNHPLDSVPVYGRWARRGPYPVEGSSSTVLAYGNRWREDGRQQITYGPSMRWIVDWNEPDRAWAVIPGGQSGHPSDSNYDNQIGPFLEGELHVAPWSEEAIAEATVYELTLTKTP